MERGKVVSKGEWIWEGAHATLLWDTLWSETNLILRPRDRCSIPRWLVMSEQQFCHLQHCYLEIVTAVSPALTGRCTSFPKSVFWHSLSQQRRHWKLVTTPNRSKNVYPSSPNPEPSVPRIHILEWMSFNNHLKKISVVHSDRPDYTYLKSFS